MVTPNSSQSHPKPLSRRKKIGALSIPIALLVGIAVTVLHPSHKAVGADAITFEGMCDASAAAALDPKRIVVADDEDNILRVYARSGGAAIYSLDVSEFLGVMGKKKPKEADLEAAAQLGNRTFWITSHGRNSKGKEQPSRERFFAVEAKIDNEKIILAPVGKPYLTMQEDLIADPRLKKYGLEAAAQLAPKSPGALNIEGLARTPKGHLLIAFRNPVPEGKALIVPLLNPNETVEGAKAQFGDPIELDLGGQGIRGIDFHEGRYVIIAGATGDGGESRVFQWDGAGKPQLIEEVRVNGINPEGISFHPENGPGEYFLLSDDGTIPVDGTPCKDLKDPSKKSFRGKPVKLPPLTAAAASPVSEKKSAE
jgi:hypothetical protein